MSMDFKADVLKLHPELCHQQGWDSEGSTGNERTAGTAASRVYGGTPPERQIEQEIP